MVGANIDRDNGGAWALHNMDTTQVLRELRVLYQRSLRARSLATAARATLNAEGALANVQQRDQQTQAAATAEDPCPLQAPPPMLLDLAFAQPTPAAATSTLTAAGVMTAAAPAVAPTPAPAPAAAATNIWQADNEDTDEEGPPGMVDSSGDSDDDDEYDDAQQIYAYGTWRSPVLLRPVEPPSPRIHWGSPPRAAQRYNNQHADEDMPEADSDTDAAETAAPARPAAMRAIRRAWQRTSRRTAAQPAQQLQQQAQDIGQSLPLLRVQQCKGPGLCSFLQRGVVFEGFQKLSQFGMRRREEQWSVRVLIEDVDMQTGRVSGIMQASNVPGMQQAIETFWEGCVIDDVQHTFYTRCWGASRDTDLQHWGKFEGWSEHIRKLVVQHSGRCGVLEHHPVIYMRWKEQFFTQQTQQDSGLSIAGFYYIALNRSTGQVRGFYYDPNSSPFQELSMMVAQRQGSKLNSGASAGASSSSSGGGGGGMAFAAYSFA